MSYFENKSILIAGAGGFIGGHLAQTLLNEGALSVRCVDIKPLSEWFQQQDSAENIVADLREKEACDQACRGIDLVFNLACDMGGMGFIELNKAACMISVLINTHLLQSARANQCERYFFASSACVYNADKQIDTKVTPLRESDAYPAMPEDGYGWEKLFSERMCRHFREDYALETRIARFHNVYGPLGSWEGGREKAPAAICRKVIEAIANESHQIEIWGDGNQTRSFMFIEDCLEGVKKIMSSDFRDPLNLGSNELVSINDLVSIVESFFDIDLSRNYNLTAPKGVNGRNSDNQLIQNVLGWEPNTPLRHGLLITCESILAEFIAKYGDSKTQTAKESLMEHQSNLRKQISDLKPIPASTLQLHGSNT